MSKVKAVFSIIFSLCLLLNSAFADYSLPFDATGFIKAGGGTTSTILGQMDGALGGGLVSILVLLYQIGDIIAVCVMVSFGIQVLLASPQRKAQLKESLYPYFIGLLLYIAGVPIAVFIINIIITIF